MAEVTVNSNLRSTSGEPIAVQGSSEPASAPAVGSGAQIPLTKTDGTMYPHQMPDYLQPEALEPPVTLTLLFENALT